MTFSADAKHTVMGLLCTIFIITAPACAQTAATDADALFRQANSEYQQGNYAQAAAVYQSLLKERENGYLYYNLGNCYLKMNEFGPAILNYRHAQKFLPRFPDLKMNLEYAYRETKDNIEDKGYSSLFTTIFFWYQYLSLKEMLIAFLVLNFLLFSLAVFRLYFSPDLLKWLLIIFGVTYLLCAGSAGFKWYQEKSIREGIVFDNEIAVRSGNNAGNVLLFKLHAGTGFQIEEIKGDWLKISLTDGKIGWVEKAGVGII
ncbi:MAG: tetratricopeptide repeat protein [Candidatus Schekmanbacteria bacterium]|nr:tetratricopeptide repeat protein [Candidatus Schekmanbacteria bacterium]